MTSGDEAVVWRAWHQQQVDEHSLGYVVRVDTWGGGGVILNYGCFPSRHIDVFSAGDWHTHRPTSKVRRQD